jgi:dienelactone hydrolase
MLARSFKPRREGVIPALALLTSAALQAQTPPELPAPTGQYAVGRRSFDWVDATRHEPALPDGAARRELLVYLWYPADGASGMPAPYLEPGQLRSEALAGAYGPAWKAVKAGSITTHTRQDAKPGPSPKSFPLLVFSPGLGNPTAAYTFLLEDLASRGFAIAAVEHTHVSAPVTFPDGRAVAADFALGGPQLAPDDQVDIISSEMRLVDLCAADLQFVLDELTRLSLDRTSAFFKKLDVKRVGVLGHSVGGRVAVRACQRDARFSACLNEDGTQFWKPFVPDDTGKPLSQPFMMIDHVDSPLPDAAFQQMHTTRAAYEEMREGNIRTARAIYESVTGGSYEVTIKVPDASHGSFSDLALLRFTTPSRAENQLRIMALDRTYTRMFFDRYLNGGTAEISAGDGHEVIVTRFGRKP